MKYLILTLMIFIIGCSSAPKEKEPQTSFKEQIDNQHNLLEKLNNELKQDQEMEELSEDGKCSHEEEREGFRCNYDLPHEDPVETLDPDDDMINPNLRYDQDPFFSN